MTTTEVELTDDVMDFSLTRRSIPFKIDDDLFEAVPEIPVEVALEFADRAERLERADVGTDEKVEIVRSLFQAVLRTDSADRFVARLRDRDNPIGMERFVRIVQWLFGEYGMRPTEPGSDSSTGFDSPASGTSSTASTFDAASTSGDSPSTAS